MKTLHPVSVVHTYEIAKPLIERAALALQTRNPWLHLADACTLALQRHQHLWVVYRAAMLAGLPSEFQRPKRRRAVPTPKDEAWQVIESLGRTVVAASPSPITLRTAVGRVVEADPTLYERYAEAGRRSRRPRNRR